MSRERRQARKAAAVQGGVKKGPWIVAGLSVALLVVTTLTLGGGNRALSHHPTPRPAAAQPAVVPSATYAQYPRVAQTYQMAAAIPSVLDGMYCHCDCSKHSGHYSLLECFSTDHGARCDVCMSEAVIAYQMTQDGATLDAIRAEVDRIYGT